MARRKDHTRTELKEMAIRSGSEIITKNGLDALSMRKIADNMGYTVGTLYNVFEHFDDLMLHISADTLDALSDYIQKNMPKSPSGIKDIQKLARLYISFAQENINLWNALTANNYAPTGGLPEWYLKRTDGLFTIIENCLSADCNNTRTIKRSAKILWASTHGICVLGLNGKLNLLKAEDVYILTDTLIENYVNGLKGQ